MLWNGSWSGVVAAFAALCIWADGAALAAQRALIIGNANYEAVSDLKWPIETTERYDQILRDHKFSTVMVEMDAGGPDLLDAFARFRDLVQTGDELLIIYTGHGFSRTTNYIAPVDAPFKGSTSQLEARSINLELELTRLHALKPKSVVVVFDACRSPLETSLLNAVSLGAAGGVSETMSAVSLQGDTLVIFSASPGQVAYDRFSNSDPAPYTVFGRQLIPLLEQGGLITDIANEVQRAVRQASTQEGRPQIPAIYNSLGKDFYIGGSRAGGGARSFGCSPGNRGNLAKALENRDEFAALRCVEEHIFFKLGGLEFTRDASAKAPLRVSAIRQSAIGPGFKTGDRIFRVIAVKPSSTGGRPLRAQLTPKNEADLRRFLSEHTYDGGTPVSFIFSLLREPGGSASVTWSPRQ